MLSYVACYVNVDSGISGNVFACCCVADPKVTPTLTSRSSIGCVCVFVLLCLVFPIILVDHNLVSCMTQSCVNAIQIICSSVGSHNEGLVFLQRYAWYRLRRILVTNASQVV